MYAARPLNRRFSGVEGGRQFTGTNAVAVHLVPGSMEVGQPTKQEATSV